MVRSDNKMPVLWCSSIGAINPKLPEVEWSPVYGILYEQQIRSISFRGEKADVTMLNCRDLARVLVFQENPSLRKDSVRLIYLTGPKRAITIHSIIDIPLRPKTGAITDILHRPHTGPMAIGPYRLC